MFATTTVFSLLLATTATAFPISWPRIVAREYTPTQLAQGTNYFFDSLHIEAQCTPGQIACISSNLAKCSPEGNWEISPCTGNTTCLAVPSSDNGLLVQCMLFTDAQAAIGDDSVSADQGVFEAPMNTATAVASPSATPTEEASTEPTDAATPTESADPNATCTDEEPEATETQTITVILTPNPTESGAFITSTLTGDSASATGEPEPSSDAAEPSVTGTDVEEQPTATATEPASAEPTCTEAPEEEGGDEQPEETDSEEVPIETVSGELPTEETPTEEAPAVETTSSTEAAPAPGPTLTIVPGNQGAAPTGAPAPEVIVGGTHFIPAAPSASAAPAPARMMRVRRST